MAKFKVKLECVAIFSWYLEFEADSPSAAAQMALERQHQLDDDVAFVRVNNPMVFSISDGTGTYDAEAAQNDSFDVGHNIESHGLDYLVEEELDEKCREFRKDGPILRKYFADWEKKQFIGGTEDGKETDGVKPGGPI